MFFYLVVHTFLGVVTISASSLLIEGRANPAFVPRWVHSIGQFFSLFGLASCIAAVITTAFTHGIVWAVVTVAEMALGAIIAVALPMGLRAFITTTSPISVIFILGCIWKFWYI